MTAPVIWKIKLSLFGVRDAASSKQLHFFLEAGGIYLSAGN